MAAFSALTTVKISDYTESIFIPEFAKRFKSKAYTPEDESKSHLIDCVLFSGFSHIYGLDVKAKCRRKFYHDTGADTKDIENYLKLPFDTYLLWVCPIEKRVYGNWLSHLNQFKTIEGKYTYFPLEEMIDFRELTQEETEVILKYTRSKYY